MIEVINRELLIPREEYNIGTCYDDNTETRHFHLKRVTSGGVDLAALTFNLDIQYADGNTDAASLVKEVTDKDINLALTINNSMLQVPGTVLIQIRALDEDGVCKWTSYKSAFFVEDHINTPGHYEGDLTQLEQYEAEWGKVRDNVNQLNLRMDEVIRIREESPATEVEEEVVDARIGADNVVYGSLGSAIREQVNKLDKEKINKFDTVSRMVTSASLDDGMYALTGGYYSVNDGGGALYRIRITQPTTYYETLTNGLYAELITDNWVIPEMFGAVGDGVTDDTNAIQAAIATGKNILFGNKTYGIGSVNTVFTLNNQTIKGGETTKFKYLNDPTNYDDSSANSKVIISFKGTGFCIENITFDANGTWYARPLVESGDAWTTYLNIRSHTYLNAQVTDASYNFCIKNCKFIGGLQSLGINKESYRGSVTNCIFCETLADSLYVHNGSHNILVENCYAYDNDDDTYCANVNDSKYAPPHDVTFINCSGTRLRGKLCETDGGNNITFINCSGDCLRTAGICAENHSEATYGSNCNNISFINCKVILNGGGGSVSDATDRIQKNIRFIGCSFIATIDTVQINFVRVGNVIFEGCNFERIYLFAESSYLKFIGCLLKLSRNIFCTLGELTLTNCEIENMGVRQDGIYANGTTLVTSRRCIDLMISNIIASNNTYKYSGSDSPTYFDIEIDPHSAAAVRDSYLDTSLVKTGNNENHHLHFNHTLDRTIASIYNNIAVANGTLAINATDVMIRLNNAWKTITIT